MKLLVVHMLTSALLDCEARHQLSLRSSVLVVRSH